MPSLRYIVGLNAPGLTSSAQASLRCPASRSATTATIAFGLTIFAIDQEDLYVYEPNPADPNQYRYDGWEPMRLCERRSR